LIERYFAKPAQNTAFALINPALKTATRNNKKFPATQQKSSPIVRENLPSGNTAWLFQKLYGLAPLAFSFLSYLFNFGCT